MIARILARAAAAILMLAPLSAAQAERRALLIGLSGYVNLERLRNPPVDVGLVDAKLRGAGFQTTIIGDDQGTRDKLLNALDAFVASVREGDEVVVFYAGHGVQLDGHNMMAPIDAPQPTSIKSNLLAEKLLRMQTFVEAVNDRMPKVHFWIFDACRTNPYGSPVRGGVPGLGQFESGIPNSLIFFSANRNQVALDRLESDPPDATLGSPFVRAFVELFDAWRGRDATRYVKQVRARVRQMVTPRDQYPIFEDAIDDLWCFGACTEADPDVRLAAASGPVLRLDAVRAATATASVGGVFAGVVGTPAVTSVRPGGTRPAVFIGKASGLDCAETVSDARPFGCALLKQVARRFAENGSSFRNRQVDATTTTAVNVRAGLPIADEGRARYGKVEKVLPEKTPVKLAGFAALRYAGDTFYWGLLERVPDTVASPR